MELSDMRKDKPDMTWTFYPTLDCFKIDMEIEKITTGDIATPTPSLKAFAVHTACFPSSSTFTPDPNAR